MKKRIVHSNDIVSCLRFDGSYHNAEANVYDSVISQHSTHKLSFYCSEIFTSGRNKRIYTQKEFGYPFLSNSDVVAANPFMSCKYSSRKYGYDENALLKKGMILTGRVGAIGQTAFVPAYLEEAKAMGSDNIIRIVVKPEFKNGFIYAYLASKIGNLSFWKHATGGVQPFITDTMVGMLPIPEFPESFQHQVDSLIQESARLREEATEALIKAKEMLSAFCDNPFEKNDGGKFGHITSSQLRHTLNLRFDAPVYINDGVTWMKNLRKETVSLGQCKIKTWYPGMFKRSYVENGLPYIKGSELFLNDPFRRCERLSRSRTP